MIPCTIIRRCALQCTLITSRKPITTSLTRSTQHFLQVSRFTTSQQYLTNKKESEEQSFEKYVERAVQEPVHFQNKVSGSDEKTLSKIDSATQENDENYVLPHPCWSAEEAETVVITHRKPKGVVDWMAYGTVTAMRKGFDLVSGYTIKSYLKTLDERDMLRRCIFLETIAGVPGFAAAMIRHLHSLRRMQRDHGWIHTLLEEAENERMHLMTFLKLRNPGPLFRALVITGQTVFTGAFSLAYIISPHFCHRFVGYLEEQAVVTYTHILEELDAGRLPMWSKLPAPDIAVTYWKLPADAMMRDVILVIRADEAHHRLVNHTLGSMDLKDKNPFKPGE